MKSHLTFEEWAENSARKPLVMALVRLLVEEKPGGGANDLVEEFRREGYGHRLDAWIREGPEGPEGMDLSPHDVDRVLGDEVIDDLAVDAEMPLDEAQAALTAILPEFISLLSPEGWWNGDAAQETLVDYLRAATGL